MPTFPASLGAQCFQPLWKQEAGDIGLIGLNGHICAYSFLYWATTSFNIHISTCLNIPVVFGSSVAAKWWLLAAEQICAHQTACFSDFFPFQRKGQCSWQSCTPHLYGHLALLSPPLLMLRVVLRFKYNLLLLDFLAIRILMYIKGWVLWKNMRWNTLFWRVIHCGHR